MAAKNMFQEEEAYGGVRFRKLWELAQTKAVNNPESVFLDKRRDCVWVVNTTDGETSTGFISKISLDGRVLEQSAIGGLLAPRGSEIVGNSLYCNQLHHLTELDLEKGAVAAAHHARDSVALNDIAVDGEGNLYSSDILGDSIYRLHGGVFENWLHDVDGLERPNGLMCEGSRMFLCPWGAGDHSTWDVEKACVMKVIDLSTKEISPLGSAPIGPLDGLEDFDRDHVIVSNWPKGKIYIVHKKTGEAHMALDTNRKSAGDIYYDTEKRLLLIPYGLDSRIEAYIID